MSMATAKEILAQIKSFHPPGPSRFRPQLPRALDAICRKCLTKQPRRRYASARELAEDLQRFLREEPILARRTTLAQRARKWLRRPDAFSSFRSGFEIRTYRLCRRVLMFHHFPTEEGVGQDCLVRSTDFVYRDSRDNPDDRTQGHPIASFVASITQHGY